MDALRAIQTRRSVREYTEAPIATETIEQIVAAARFAPTARAVQPWEFVVVRDRAMLKKIAAIAEHGRFIAAAAACIAVFCRDTKYYLEDGCAATQTILLAATVFGIGSCWVAGDKKPYCREISVLLNAAPLKLVSLISLGYPAAALSGKEKRPLAELLHWERYRG